MEGAVEAEIRDRLPAIDDVDLGNGIRGLVLKKEVAGAGEGATFGEDVDLRVDGENLRLRQELVLLEVALVLRLEIALRRGTKELIQNVGVVEVPCSATDGDQQKESSGGDQPWRSLPEQAKSRAPAFIRATQREAYRQNAENSGDREPVGDGPEKTRDEMPVTVHVRVGVARCAAEEVERILPTVTRRALR